MHRDAGGEEQPPPKSSTDELQKLTMQFSMRLGYMSNYKQRFHPFVVSLCLLAGVLAISAAAQDRPAPIPNSIWVGADGKFEAEPDTVLVQFNISAQDDTVKGATDRGSRSAEQVRELLRKNGIDPKQAEIGRFSVDPVYDYRNAKRKLLGYRVNTGITIKLKDFGKVGPITQGLSDLDITDSQSLNYILENMDAAKIKAVEDALSRAKDEANAAAVAAGRSLGALSYASIDTYEIRPVRPVPMMAKAAGMAEAAPPAPTEEFGTQKITVTAHVNALYNLK